MNNLIIAASLLTFTAAYAQAPSGKSAAPSGKSAAPSGTTAAPAAGGGGMEMMPPKPGPETEALKPFAKNITSTGKTMGPDGKEMATKGKSTCKWIDNGLWVQCDIEDTMMMPGKPMKWMGHWVFGYDMMAKGYRGMMADSMGMMMPMKGTLEGTKLTFESMNEMKGMPPGMPSKMRFSIDAANPKSYKFNEEWFEGGKWVEHGSADFKPAGK